MLCGHFSLFDFIFVQQLQRRVLHRNDEQNCFEISFSLIKVSGESFPQVEYPEKFLVKYKCCRLPW